MDRTFPDIDYFKLERVRRCMVSILFLWAIQNPDVGYRQVSLLFLLRKVDWTDVSGDARASSCLLLGH